MNTIVKILMERDNMSQEEAEDLLNDAREEANNLIEQDAGILEVEDILYQYFGLEPDYLFDLIEL